MTYEVVCVNIDRGSDYDDCRCISLIGILAKGGGVNTYTPEKIHYRIVEEGDDFFVEEDGTRTYLEAVNREGTKYVRTESNDTSEDNLLQQKSC